MAGKKDIVEQALKLVVGSGEKVAPKVRTIRNLKGVPIAPPVEFYRGTNPGSTERIVTGAPEWDSYLFAADNPDAARLYGSEIEKITANPDAKILYEGTADWNKIAGRWRKNENMLQYADRAAKAAKEAGYDAAWFKRQSDIGTPIFNVEKFVRGQKAEGGSIREGYGPGGWVDDVVKMAGKVISGEGEDAAKDGIRAYHGSPQKGLKRLSTRYAVETPDAVFAAQNPDVAHTFTVPREYGEPVYVDEFGNDIEPGEVFELDLRPQNPFSVPPEDAQKFIDDTAFQTRLVREAREKGHDLVVAPNVMEGIGERSPGDVYAVLDDRIISIIRKYGIAGASAMLGYNLLENLSPDQALAASAADQEYQHNELTKANGGSVREGYQTKGRVLGSIVDQALGVIRAYHVSPHDFDVFKPSEFRGSTFFSSTPERARRGAEAGRNEMVMETATELPSVNWRTYEVEIDPSRIKGLSLTPSESKWFEGLPGKIVGDDALAEATKGIPPGMYWDDFYDETPVKEGVYEYIKKSSPPSMSYEDAISKNRDIYRTQWPHYAGSTTDEKASALRLSKQGMGGYLVQDEGGLSFAINDPSIVKILKKYEHGGRIAKGPGGWLDDVVKMAGKVISGEGEDAAKAGIRAYHASPHDFDKFEWSPRTSMTGEGAQSYGAGLYFAESPSVSGRGGTYDKQFTRKLQEIDRTGELGEKMGRVKIGGKPSTEYGIENDPGFIEAVKAGNVGKYARERLDRWHELSTDEKYPYRDYAAEKMRAWEKLLNDYSGGADVYYPMKARIYETNIAADPEKMMRWDEPLKDQPVEVLRGLGVLNAEDIAALQAEKRALESKLQGGGWNDPIETQNPDEFWEKVNTSVAKNSDDYSRLMKIERELSRAGKDIPDVTSGKFYKSSSEKPENISLELRDRGVPGIQFWDGNSRGKSYFSQWRTDPLGGWTTDAFPSKGEATEYLNDVLRSAPALKGDERFSRVIQNPKATSNYVITNDKLISIIRKYGIAGASAMLGYNLMENLDPKQAQAASMADQDFQASRPRQSAGGNNAVSGAVNVARGLNGVK